MSSGKIHSLGYVYVPFRNDESKERIEKKIKNTEHPHGSFNTLSF